MSARLRLSHASGWATTCSPSKSWEASPLCVTVTTTGSQPGAVKVSVAERFDDSFAVAVTANDVEVLPDVRAGVHHAVLSLCVSDHAPASVRRSSSRLPPAASNSISVGVTESILPPVSPVLSSLHDTDTESTSASSRKRNFFIAESRLKFVSGPAVRSGTVGQKRDGNLCVPSRESVAVIRPLPGSCPRT